jgi:hypothetical protein
MMTRSALFWDITQRQVVILYRRFGTTYRSPFKGQEAKEENTSWISWQLKMWPIRCPVTSVEDYHLTLHNIPEQGRSQASYWSWLNVQLGDVRFTCPAIQDAKLWHQSREMVQRVTITANLRRRAGSLYKLLGPGRPEGGPGPDYVAYVFCLPRQYHYLSIVHITPFRPSQSYSAAENQFLRCSVKIFNRSTLYGGGGPKKLSHRGPKPLSAALVTTR